MKALIPSDGMVPSAFIPYSLKAKTKYWLTQEKGVRTIGIKMRLKSAKIQTAEGIGTGHGLEEDRKVIECEADT